MPRDIDYNLKAKSQLIRKNLNEQNAIINAISKGNITKAEMLSGTDLVPRDPIYQGLVMKQKEVEDAKEKVRDIKQDEINEDSENDI